jgi:hypothetical protein
MRARAGGRAPSTSASPPVFENGSASEPIISTRGRRVSAEIGRASVTVPRLYQHRSHLIAATHYNPGL